MSDQSEPYQAWSCAQNGQPAADVYQQSLGKQSMGWIITRNNRTAAVSNDHQFCERLNLLEGLVEVLSKMDTYHNLADLCDQGVIEITDDEREYLRKTCEALGVKRK